jgi:phage terminase small subunit
MALTPKQEAFCLAYMETGNASEAYRRAYDTDGMKPSTINRNAKAMLDNNKIAARVAGLKQELSDRTLWTFADSAKVLIDIAQKIDSAENAKIAAVKELNSMHGFAAPTESNVNLRNGADPEAIRQALERKHRDA